MNSQSKKSSKEQIKRSNNKPTLNQLKKIKKFYQQLFQIKLSSKSSYIIILLNWCFPPLTIAKVLLLSISDLETNYLLSIK
jgi:hypothetical protein